MGEDDEMTISREERKAAMTRVMVLLAEMFRDAPRRPFRDDDIASAAPLLTTVEELKDKQWIQVNEFFGGDKDYELTKPGWSHAQHIAGYFETPEGVERVGRLRSALKDAVKVNGRREEALCEYQDIAKAANVPEGWVWNMVEGQELAFLDRTRNYWVKFEDDGLIYVPPTFGQEIVKF